MDDGSWPGWNKRVHQRLEAIRDTDRWRHPRSFDARGPAGILCDVDTDHNQSLHPTDVVSFASNDYLGLSVHPAVCDAAIDAVHRWGTGSGASRLVVGTRPVHDELEAEIATWKHTERAVLFPTGYAANLGILTALIRAAGRTPRPLICSDTLNHASIIDATRLADADVAVYAHCDVAAVDDLLSAARRDGRPAVVVSDSVFSMDGDVAPVNDLIGVSQRHGALLVLDEAHAVLGPDPVASSNADATVLRMTTLSKTLGALGGAVAGPAELIDLLINTARPYIFTTALSPADTAAALAALRVFRSDEGVRLVARLRHHVDRLRPGHPSPIVPIIVGTDRAALELSTELLARGLLVPAIRPPTVPDGTARLRVTLSAAHTDEQVDHLIESLSMLGIPVGVA